MFSVSHISILLTISKEANVTKYPFFYTVNDMKKIKLFCRCIED